MFFPQVRCHLQLPDDTGHSMECHVPSQLSRCCAPVNEFPHVLAACTAMLVGTCTCLNAKRMSQVHSLSSGCPDQFTFLELEGPGTCRLPAVHSPNYIHIYLLEPHSDGKLCKGAYGCPARMKLALREADAINQVVNGV